MDTGTEQTRVSFIAEFGSRRGCCPWLNPWSAGVLDAGEGDGGKSSRPPPGGRGDGGENGSETNDRVGFHRSVNCLTSC